MDQELFRVRERIILRIEINLIIKDDPNGI
jgi:hypothetical protein